MEVRTVILWGTLNIKEYALKFYKMRKTGHFLECFIVNKRFVSSS